MGSTGSAVDSPFDPYDANVLLAADVVYDFGKIPSLVRSTQKFLLLPDRALPSPPRRRGSAQTVAVIVVVRDSHRQRRQKEEEEEEEEGGNICRHGEEPSYLQTV